MKLFVLGMYVELINHFGSLEDASIPEFPLCLSLPVVLFGCSFMVCSTFCLLLNLASVCFSGEMREKKGNGNVTFSLFHFSS